MLHVRRMCSEVRAWVDKRTDLELVSQCAALPGQLTLLGACEEQRLHACLLLLRMEV